MNVTPDRLGRLEAVLERQENEIAELRTQLATAISTPAVVPEAKRSRARSTRRSVLVGGAVAVGAAIAGVAGRPGTAAAADGSTMLVGRLNSSDGADTRIRSTSAGQLTGVNIFTVTDDQSSSTYEAAIGAVAQGVKVHNGVYAYTSSRGTSTDTGHAIVARKTSGGRSHIHMPPSSGAPTFDTYAHAAGELRVDFNRTLWYCTDSGTPGRWIRLAAPQSTGAVHAVTPTRVYDSRFTGGPLATGFDRVVSVASSIDVVSGTVVNENFVPLGALAIMFNLTVTQTAGRGNIFLAPGDATTVTSSTINWSAAGISAANASLTTLDDNRQVRAFAGGAGSAHFIIDVTGYLL